MAKIEQQNFVVIDPFQQTICSVVHDDPKAVIQVEDLGWWTEDGGNTVFWCDDVGLMKPGIPTFRLMKGNEESQPIAGIVAVSGRGAIIARIRERVRWSPLKTDDFELVTDISRGPDITRIVTKAVIKGAK